jgi:hypothetical protein
MACDDNRVGAMLGGMLWLSARHAGPRDALPVPLVFFTLLALKLQPLLNGCYVLRMLGRVHKRFSAIAPLDPRLAQAIVSRILPKRLRLRRLIYTASDPRIVITHVQCGHEDTHSHRGLNSTDISMFIFKYSIYLSLIISDAWIPHLLCQS